MTEQAPLDLTTLAERAYFRLRHDVETGVLRPGQRLDELHSQRRDSRPLSRRSKEDR